MALVFVDLKMTGYVLVFSSLKLLHRNLFSMIKPFTLVRLFVSCSDQIGLSFPSLSKITIVPQRSNRRTVPRILSHGFNAELESQGIVSTEATDPLLVRALSNFLLTLGRNH